VTSLEGENLDIGYCLVVFCCLHLKSGLIRRVAFGEIGLIRRVAFGEIGLI
jgi:hypothetical protein